MFSWFVKHDDDYESASGFLRKYMSTIKPYVVFTYGAVPTYAATQNFKSFTSRDHLTAVGKMNRTNQNWSDVFLGNPSLQAFDGTEEVTNDNAFVLIPCYHPGFSGHAGVIKDKLVRLMSMTFGLGWAAAGHAVELSDQPGLSRKEKCNLIIQNLQSKLEPSHELGKIWARSKSEYALANAVDKQAWALRMKHGKIGNLSLFKLDLGYRKPPPPGAKVRPSRAKPKVGIPSFSKIDEEDEMVDGIGGYPVVIEPAGNPIGAAFEQGGYRLRWPEENGLVWSLEPVFLPNKTVSGAATDKERFLY